MDEKATPGNWYESHGWLESDPDTQVAQGFGDDPQWLADAALITGLRNALPAVVTLIEAAQAYLRVQDEVTRQQGHDLDIKLAERHADAAAHFAAALAPFVGEATQ